jgi:hypothetical protein
MTVLTNNFPLSLRVINDDKASLTEVPVGSKLNYIRQTTGYHAYYEMHTYTLYCLFDSTEVLISCSKYVDGKEPKVDCIKGNIHLPKKYYWSEVFDEVFPK